MSRVIKQVKCCDNCKHGYNKHYDGGEDYGRSCACSMLVCTFGLTKKQIEELDSLFKYDDRITKIQVSTDNVCMAYKKRR